MAFLELAFQSGADQVLRVGFGQAKGLLMDWRPAFQEMARSYQAYESAVFATEGAAGLGRWEPLSPKYKAWKDKKYPGRPIGTLTGALGTAARTILYLGPDRMVMGPGRLVPYGRYFDRRRPFVHPSAQQITVFREIARQHILKARQAMKKQIPGAA